MNVFKLSFKNLTARPMRSLLTVVMLTMGVALASLLILVGNALNDSFRNNIRGIDMVVGAKGSPLQLILSAVYQIDNPTGNIDLEEARDLPKIRRSKRPLNYLLVIATKGDALLELPTHTLTCTKEQLPMENYGMNLLKPLLEHKLQRNLI